MRLLCFERSYKVMGFYNMYSFLLVFLQINQTNGKCFSASLQDNKKTEVVYK